MKNYKYIATGYLILSTLYIFIGIYFHRLTLFTVGLGILGSLVAGTGFGIYIEEEINKK